MKKVLLFAPDWINIIDLFERNLISCGYNVVIYKSFIPEFRYKSFKQKAYNFYRKLFLKDYTYKQHLREAFIINVMAETKTKDDIYDFGLMIRPDLLSLEDLAFIKMQCKQLIGYQFDGLDRTPNIFARRSFFDKFFVFDPEDIKKYPAYNFQFAPNFYFDYPEINSDTEESINIYYLGAYHPGRFNDIIAMQQYLSKENIAYRIDIIFGAYISELLDISLKKKINCLKDSIDFELYLNNVRRASVLLDFILPEHSGLSFRIFESLKYGKKIITTNTSVKLYDFYDPDNIFVLEKNFEEIPSFLKKPYRTLSDEIKRKYSFTYWINHLFSSPEIKASSVIYDPLLNNHSSHANN